MLEQRIQQQFFDSADLKYAAAEILSRPIADAVQALMGCITAGGKVSYSVVPRRRKEGEVQTSCCTRDEGRSLGAGLRRQAPNHLERLGLRAPVVSIQAKGTA